MSAIKILIADDHPVVRKGMRDILDSTIGFEIIGETGDGLEALIMIQELAPNVALLDIELPGMTGIEITKKLVEDGSETKVLAISSYSDKIFISEMLSLGAAGYLMKDEVPDTIANAIRGVARGETGWLSPEVAAILSDMAVQDQRSLADLTNREIEVLEILVTGATNLKIGTQLGITDKTVEKHLQSIFQKLGAESRVEAAVLAIDKNIVAPPE